MSYTFQQLVPTPARGKYDPKYLTDPDWWAEEKYDGDRRIAQFTGELVRFTGRRISDVDGLFVEKTDCVPQLKGGAVVDIDVPHHPVPRKLVGTVLDGEMVSMVPGARSKDVTSIMGSKPELAIQKQKERGWLHFRVFDCLFYKGNDIRNEPLVLRRDAMLDALDLWKNPYAAAAQRIDDDREEFLLGLWKQKKEGIILKHKGSLYTEEDLWVKVKRVETHDVVIMGYEDAKKTSVKVSGKLSETKYAAKGWIGAVVFGQYLNGKLTECGKCSGMDDKLRKELSENKKKYLMSVVEILANEREPTGKFRHPRWVQFRDNKNPKDCVWRNP